MPLYENLREKAIKRIEKEKKKRQGVYVVGWVFAVVSVILFVVSTQFSGEAVFWTRFPIIILALVYSIVHVSTLGFPFLKEDELSEEEIEREMVKIYKRSNLNKISEEPIDRLELKQIEEIELRQESQRDML